MLEIKEDKYFYITTLEGVFVVSISSKDFISIDKENMGSIAILLGSYTIKNNLFILDKDGEWECVNIHQRYNDDRKWWQFWKPKIIYTKIDMRKKKRGLIEW